MSRLLAALLLLIVTNRAAADVKLADAFSDGMVVQRDLPLNVWGTADAGEAVTIALGDQTATATAGGDGRWLATLPPTPAGGPFELRANDAIVRDVLVGEVWVCSGQSNMEWPVDQSDDAAAEIAAAQFPQMRILTVPKRVSLSPVKELPAAWQPVTPETIGDFSAVAYFMGRRLHRDLGVPIGLVDATWGGTPIEAWMSRDALDAAEVPESDRRVRAALAGVTADTVARASGGSKLIDERIAKPQWAEPDYGDGRWSIMTLPAPFDANGPDVDGVVWFRREFELPADAAAKGARLTLGTIDDNDVTFISGVEVGRTDGYSVDRAYDVPAGVLRPGRNVVAVRVFDAGGAGGFTGTADQMRLTGGAEVDLSGEWRCAFERAVAPDVDLPTTFELAQVPTTLFNGMIAPLTPMTARGFAWYQGETNAGRPEEYAPLLRSMIASWRAEFGGGQEQPFLVVQLANFTPRSDDPNGRPGWALIRDAQRKTAADVPGVGLAVTIDVGEADDVHPRDKQSVGDRLARLALRDVYGRDVAADGPTLRSATRDGESVVLRFDHAAGLTLIGPADQTFAVAGDDGRFAWATPTVEGDAVRLTCPAVAEPRVVRYAWQMNPPAPLYNGAGLPAVPFEARVE